MMSEERKDRFRATEQFEVEALLGSGGFGEVYKAFDRHARQTVALKVLHRREPDALLRFKNEFRSLRDIQHRNLVTFFELHQSGDDWFFTMEYVDGTPLHDHPVLSSSRGARPASSASTDTTSPLRAQSPSIGLDTTLVQDGPSTPPAPNPPPTLGLAPAPHPAPPSDATVATVDEEALREVFLQLAEGIGWLHECGKLHCDIKPSNVIVDSDGRVVLLDFGLATTFTDRPNRALLTSSIVGTPGFMAPEVCSEAEPIPASDWYGFGVVLYLALTGVVPFRGSRLNMIMAKQTYDATPPGELVLGLPSDLDLLCTRLLARDPEARPAFDEIVGVLKRHAPEAHGAPSTPRGRLEQPFVGREQELQTLRSAVATDEPSVALVSGLSGYGKSSLVEHFLGSLPDDVWSLRSRCYARGTVHYRAFDGAVDELTRRLQSLPDDEWEAACPANMWALARLFPVLQGLPFPTPPDADSLEASVVRRRAYAAMRDLLSPPGRRTVLVIDDLQWADDESIGMLQELLQPVVGEAPPITVIAIFRSDEVAASPTLPNLLGVLESVDQVHSVHLGPLPRDAQRALASALLGEGATEEQIARLVGISEGSPLFLEEISRRASLDELHPEALTSVIQERVSALPESARRYLELVSVAGQPVPESLVAEGLQEGATPLKLLLDLSRQRLLRTTASDGVAVYHDKIREAVTTGLEASRSRALHATLARAAAAGGYADDDPEFAVVHFEAAGDPRAAARHAVPAAERAFSALAFDRAAEHYRTAIRYLGDEDGTLSSRLAEALEDAGRGPEAAEAYLAAAERADVAEAARRLRIEAVEQYLFAGAYDAGEAVIREVLGTLGLSVAGSTLAAFAQFGWQGLKLRRRGQRYVLTEEDDLAMSVRNTIEILWSATIGLSMANPMAAQAIQKRHLLAALDAGEPRRLVRALSIELAFSGIEGGSDERLSDDLSRRGHELADAVGDPYSKAFMTMSDGAVHWLRGRWAEAEAAVETSLKTYEEHCKGVTWETDTARFVALSTCSHRGQLADVRARLPGLLADAEQRGDLYFETQLRTRFSPLIALADDQPGRAIDELTEAIRRWTARGYHIVHFWTLLSHANALLYQGRYAEAARHVKAGEGALWRSLMLAGQYYRVQYHDVRARASLAAACSQGPRTARGRALLARARFHARRLLKEDLPWAWPHGHLVTALCASAKGSTTEAVDGLHAAAAGFEDVEMHLHAAVARYRRAELRGDSVDVHARRLQAEGITVPQRFCDMLAPR